MLRKPHVIESPSGRIRKGTGFPFPMGWPRSVLFSLGTDAATDAKKHKYELLIAFSLVNNLRFVKHKLAVRRRAPAILHVVGNIINVNGGAA
jgi:hypothetical protein